MTRGPPSLFLEKHPFHKKETKKMNLPIEIHCKICGEILILEGGFLFCPLMHGTGLPVLRSDAARFRVTVRKQLGTFKPSPGRPPIFFFELNGEKKSVSEWAKDLRCAVKAATLRWRLRCGPWTPAEAILLPAFKKGKHLGNNAAIIK